MIETSIYYLVEQMFTSKTMLVVGLGKLWKWCVSVRSTLVRILTDVRDRFCKLFSTNNCAKI